MKWVNFTINANTFQRKAKCIIIPSLKALSKPAKVEFDYSGKHTFSQYRYQLYSGFRFTFKKD